MAVSACRQGRSEKNFVCTKLCTIPAQLAACPQEPSARPLYPRIGYKPEAGLYTVLEHTQVAVASGLLVLVHTVGDALPTTTIEKYNYSINTVNPLSPPKLPGMAGQAHALLRSPRCS